MVKPKYYNLLHFIVRVEGDDVLQCYNGGMGLVSNVGSSNLQNCNLIMFSWKTDNEQMYGHVFG